MNCVGVGPDGRQVRFPSLGSISGDVMDGARRGRPGRRRARRPAARTDGARRPSSSGSSRSTSGCATPVELARAVHGGRIPWRRLGELAPLVFDAADTDAVAAEIVDRQAAEVVAFVRAARQPARARRRRGGGRPRRRRAPVRQPAPARRDRGRAARGRSATRRCASRARGRSSARCCSGSTGSARAPDAYERARDGARPRDARSVGDVAGDAAAVAELP